MILVDANLLVYAHARNVEQHEAAQAWLDGRLNGPGRVGLPWPSLLAFLRLVTNPRIFSKPTALPEAWKVVEGWLGATPAWIPTPGEGHAEILRSLLPHASGRPALVPDAHLAALAIEHGLSLFSADGDFARFPGLTWRNPMT